MEKPLTTALFSPDSHLIKLNLRGMEFIVDQWVLTNLQQVAFSIPSIATPIKGSYPKKVNEMWSLRYLNVNYVNLQDNSSTETMKSEARMVDDVEKLGANLPPLPDEADADLAPLIHINFDPNLFGFLLEWLQSINSMLDLDLLKSPVTSQFIRQEIDYFLIPHGSTVYPFVPSIQQASPLDPLYNVPPRRLFIVALLRKALGLYLSKNNICPETKEEWDFHELEPGKCRLLSLSIIPTDSMTSCKKCSWQKSMLKFKIPEGLLDKIELRAKQIWQAVVDASPSPPVETIPPFEQVEVVEITEFTQEPKEEWWESFEIECTIWTRSQLSIDSIVLH